MKALYATVALLLLAVSALGANNRDTCDSTGKYCVADTVFDCVNGTPTGGITCDSCRDGECVDAPIAPDVKVNEVPPPKPMTLKNDLLLPIIIAIAIAATLILYLKLRVRSRKKPAL